ncbi:MAG: hypothetical protein KDC38_13795 [Planctomycetes bacterium]|nr:hypothetical protein [Planctomycetota bacterium]
MRGSPWIALCTVLSIAMGVSAEEFVPTSTVFSEGFEIGDLEDASLTSIQRIEDYLPRAWEPQVEGFPLYMAPSLERISGPLGVRGRRYLRYPVASADAEIRSPSFTLQPWMKLRVSADLHWRGIGDGRFHVGLRYSDGTRVPFVTGAGPDRDWTTLVGESVVPDGVTFGWVEIWIEGDHKRNRGEHGIDNIRVEILPRVSIRTTSSFRRVDLDDLQPFRIQTVGFPPGEYDITLNFRDVHGEIDLRTDLHKFVRRDRQIDFEPRLRWRSERLARGLYEVEARVTSADGWVLEDRTTFVLGGEPRFAYRGAPGRWGLVLPWTAEPPVWLSSLGQPRFLIEPTPQDLTGATPAWIERLGEYRRAIAFDPRSSWPPETVNALLQRRLDFLDWYWVGEPDVADPVLNAMAAGAPYVRTGLRIRLGEGGNVGDRRLLWDLDVGRPDLRSLATLDPGRQSFDVWIDGAALGEGEDASARLATALVCAAARSPQVVYLASPERAFVRAAERGDWIPQPALLAWEFVTSFLSGATFDRYESFDDRALLATWIREGQPYLYVVGGDEGGAIDLYARRPVEGITVHEPEGNSDVLAVAPDGRVRFPLTSRPALLAGVDVARMRTERSIALERGEATSGSRGVPLVLKLTNRFEEAADVTFDLRFPPGWSMERLPLDARRLDAGERGAWSFEVDVPSWFGAEQARSLTGHAALQLADRTVDVPIDVELPVADPRVSIVPLSLDGSVATVRVANQSDRALTLSVYLELEPLGRSRRFRDQRLAAGASAQFDLAIDGTRAGEQLFVGVVIENDGERVNRVFPLE